MRAQPRLLVLSQLFPSAAQPLAGVFVRERMFRVAQHIRVVVVAPQPWFPLQGLIRRVVPHFRPPAIPFEVMQGIEVHRPRFLSFPGVLKWADGFFLALCTLHKIRSLVRKHELNMLDVHFGYPDGYAGVLLGRWLRLPVVITLRGKEERQARMDVGSRLRRAIAAADRLVCVSDALKEVAVELGAAKDKVTVVGNGIDLSKFAPIDGNECRAALGLPVDAKVMVSVGGLIERKGFHRVIECLPALLARHPNLYYLIVGGAGPAGDMSNQLHHQVEALGLKERVRFLGPYAPERLKIPLSAADIFVLATSYEGWANVFLEAMACGLPVVTTRVGGNAQVVNSPNLGEIVDYGDPGALTEAISAALTRRWDRPQIMQYARSNAWDRRIPPLLEVFNEVLECRALVGAEGRTARAGANRG
jgi:glycosyltransferase involved in cell wall biosynthesis